MKYRKFGQLDFEASAIGFGGGAISGEGAGYGFGHISETDATHLLHAALDRGINLFDTAPIYGFGTSEVRIGKAFKKNRDKVFIVSKCGVDWHDSKRVNMTNEPKVAERMLNESLERLQTDYIDLYMIHWPDEKFDIRETLKVLSAAKQAGKIRAIGLCNTNPDEIRKAKEVDQIDVAQSEFNLFRNWPKRELFPTLDEENIGFMSWGTLDKGIITGSVTRDRKFDEVDARSRAPWWKKADHEPKFLAMDQIGEILQKEKHSGLELALGHVLSHPTLSTALCGAKNSDQLDSLIAALDNLPSASTLAACQQIAKEVLE